eukprot:177020_1
MGSKTHKKKRKATDGSSDSRKRKRRKHSKKHKKRSKSHKKKDNRKKSSKRKKDRKSAKEDDPTVGPPTAKPGITPITTEDYFKRSAEFRVWMQSKHDLYLDEIDSKKAQKYFKKFVERWNLGKLNGSLYKGIDSSSIESGTTRHRWKFDISEKDQMQLSLTRDTVDTQTHHKPMFNSASNVPRSEIQSSSSRKRSRDDNKVMTDADRVMHREDQRKRDRADKREWKRDQRAVMDELAPKPDAGSWQAKIEKRREKGAYTRKRSASPGMRDDALMGGGDDGFQKRVDSRKYNRERRNAHLNVKLQSYQAKEAATMDRFRQLLAERKPPLMK